MEEIIERTIYSFLDENKKLTKMPRRRGKMLYALLYLFDRFDTHVTYSERQVNDILDEWHTFHDCALLRRMLFEEGLFERKLDGSGYWVNAEKASSLRSMLIEKPYK